MLATLAVAALLVVVGLAVLAHGKPTVATVYATDARGPEVTFDGRPKVERGPQFRVLVGDSRKEARWKRVNLVQYTSCTKGDWWNGTLCSKSDFALPALPGIGARGVALTAVCVVMVVVPLLALRGRR